MYNEKEVEDTNKIRQAKIMIIDDDINMMDIVSVFLNKYGHTVSTFSEPVSAIETLKEIKYDILIVNYLMIPVTGDRIVELVREFDKGIYIILMSVHKDIAPSIDTMNNLDIQAYYEKSSRFDQLIMLIQSGIKHIEQIRQIKSMNIKLEKYLVDFAEILLKTVDAKDHYTKEHSKRVCEFSRFFGEYLNLPADELNNLKTAALFHDIGKIGIPDDILLKEGKLEPDEYDVIKSHPVIGANIFSVSDIYKDVSPIIYNHHQRIDGKGYPGGLKANEIPYLAKILSITDSFDAIISRRPYKDTNTLEFALDQIKGGKNTQFDAELSDKFIEFVTTKTDVIKNIIG